MSTDTFNNIAAADVVAKVCTSNRPQPYRFIHKGLRVLLAKAQQTAGALDPENAIERTNLVVEVERALSVCADHLAHENRFFHEPLRQRAPRATLAFDADHHEHLVSIAHLRLLLQQVRDDQENVSAKAYALYLEFSRFVGENLQHMAEEETVLTQALWQHFTDSEILGLEDALRAELSPEESIFYLGWMARGLNVPELYTLLDGARRGAPPEVFEHLMDTVSASMDSGRWARLAQLLGRPAVPGLVQ